jgi:type IV secretion system protein VirB2
MEDMPQIRRLPQLTSPRAEGSVATRRSATAWLTTGSLATKCVATASLAILFTVVLASPANAAGSGMPWEAPLQRILESIEGPVAKVVAVVTIIITGLSLAFGDMGGGLRRLIQIVFGLSIAFAATSFFLSFFSFAGGAVIN